MQRNLGRVGGAAAGVIAVIFGVLDLIDKVPQFALIGLGALAVVGVMLDYFFQSRGSDEQAPSSVKQTQVVGDGSTGLQAGRDIGNVQFGDGGGGEPHAT